MKRCGDSTHHCRSPTPTLNDCDLTASTWTQSSELEYSYLTARHLSTPYCYNTPQSFLRGTQPFIYFPQADKACVYVFSMLPGFLETLLESENLFCSATATTKTAPGIIQLGSIILAASWHTLFLGGLAKGCSWFIPSCLHFCV